MSSLQSIAARATTSVPIQATSTVSNATISATTTIQATSAGKPDRAVCYVQGCYFSRPYHDLREIQRHCRITHGIVKENFDYRGIGPAQHLAVVQPLRKTQIAREKRQRKLAARRTTEPPTTTHTPQIVLPAMTDQQLAQSVQMLNIVDSAHNLGEMPAPVGQAAVTSYHSLNTAPINKIVDFFSLNKELEPGFKNSSGLESITVQAASANIKSLKARVDTATNKVELYEKKCGEYKEKFDTLISMLEYSNVTAESLNKAIAIMREGKSVEPALWALKDRDGLSIGTYEDGTRADEASEEVPELEEAMAGADVEMEEEDEEGEEEESSGDESEEEGEEKEPEWPGEEVFYQF